MQGAEVTNVYVSVVPMLWLTGQEYPSHQRSTPSGEGVVHGIGASGAPTEARSGSCEASPTSAVCGPVTSCCVR